MYRRKNRSEQGTLWVPTHKLAVTGADPFYAKLSGELDRMRFGEHVRELCTPYYDSTGRGHPGTDPEVFFRMLMVGFFENLSSERSIAERCADSLKIRAFLGYGLSERTPDHSTLCRFRQRIPEQVFYAAFDRILEALNKSGLVKGRQLGIDSSVIEANASMRSLVSRLTQEEYTAYVRRLAAEAGVDPEDGAAVRTFDRKRKGRKTSNREWNNPHDEDARVGKTKRGNTRMLYKAEHVVDMSTGAIVDAKVRFGDQGDATDLFERLGEAEERINRAMDREPDAATIGSITADKGYYRVDDLTHLQHVEIETNIARPNWQRPSSKLSAKRRAAVDRAERVARCESGRFLSRRRAALVERSFAHVLEAGALRRTTLRGKANVSKRYVVGALCFNLSLLMRTLYGVGTAKQALARRWAAFLAFLAEIERRLSPSSRGSRLLRYPSRYFAHQCHA